MHYEDEEPIKLTINSEYAKKYEERKRGEELSKRKQDPYLMSVPFNQRQLELTLKIFGKSTLMVK